LHPAQEDEEQPLQPEPDDEENVSPKPLPMPNRDIRFFVFLEPHFGQATSGFEPKTSFSKQLWHLMHWYS